jgi:tryptophan-rich sensory protein
VSSSATPPSPVRSPVALPLLGSVAVTLTAAFAASFASRTSGAFYAVLDKPAWAPPPWLFAPAWGTLYLLMALAAFRIWRGTGLPAARGALGLYVGQLVLNALWTWLFFVWRDGPWATAEVVMLWTAILATLVAFWRRDRLAGLLLLPYLGWVSFATALTISVWQRNPTLL